MSTANRPVTTATPDVVRDSASLNTAATASSKPLIPYIANDNHTDSHNFLASRKKRPLPRDHIPDEDLAIFGPWAESSKVDAAPPIAGDNVAPEGSTPPPKKARKGKGKGRASTSGPSTLPRVRITPFYRATRRNTTVPPLTMVTRSRTSATTNLVGGDVSLDPPVPSPTVLAQDLSLQDVAAGAPLSINAGSSTSQSTADPAVSVHDGHPNQGESGYEVVSSDTQILPAPFGGSAPEDTGSSAIGTAPRDIIYIDNDDTISISSDEEVTGPARSGNSPVTSEQESSMGDGDETAQTLPVLPNEAPHTALPYTGRFHYAAPVNMRPSVQAGMQADSRAARNQPDNGEGSSRTAPLPVLHDPGPDAIHPFLGIRAPPNARYVSSSFLMVVVQSRDREAIVASLTRGVIGNAGLLMNTRSRGVNGSVRLLSDSYVSAPTAPTTQPVENNAPVAPFNMSGEGFAAPLTQHNESSQREPTQHNMAAAQRAAHTGDDTPIAYGTRLRTRNRQLAIAAENAPVASRTRRRTINSHLDTVTEEAEG